MGWTDGDWDYKARGGKRDVPAPWMGGFSVSSLWLKPGLMID